MTVNEPAGVNPYLAGRGGHLEAHARYVIAARNWRWTGVLALLVAALSVAGMIMVATQSQVVPYVVKVDKLGEAVPVGRADRLPVLHPAAREQPARNARPMIAAGVLVDRRGSAELAPHDHRHVLVHPAVVQILDQCGYALIKHGHVLAGAIEIAAVPVPSTER